MFSVLPPGPTPTVSTLRTAAGKKSSSMPPAGMQFLFFVWEWSVAAPCDVGRRRPPAATPSDLSFLCRLRFFLHLSVEPPPVLARWSLPPPCSPHEPSPACAGVPPHLSSDNATTAQGRGGRAIPPLAPPADALVFGPSPFSVIFFLSWAGMNPLIHVGRKDERGPVRGGCGWHANQWRCRQRRRCPLRARAGSLPSLRASLVFQPV